MAQFHFNALFFHLNYCDNPLTKIVRLPTHLSLVRAHIAQLIAFQPFYINIWFETDENGNKFYVFGATPDSEATVRQAIYHITLSLPALQCFEARFCFGALTYDLFDLLITDIRSGITYFEDLPRSLKQVILTMFDGAPGTLGLIRAQAAIKKEFCRIARLLVGCSEDNCIESRMCREHGQQSYVSHNWQVQTTSAAQRRTLLQGKC